MAARAWGTFAPLEMTRGEQSICVRGGTFAYGFDAGSGLIHSIRIHGRQCLSPGRPVPDLWASDRVDPRGHEFEARRETRARVKVVRSSAEQVVIEARGRYLSRHGEALPLEYRLEYTIDPDGVIRVEVDNRGTSRGAVRWLVFSQAAMPARLVDFVNHSEDLAQVQARTGGFSSEPVPPGDGTILSGQFYPWLQLGNDTMGLDLTVDVADEIAHGATDSMPYYDGMDSLGATCEVVRHGGRVSWRYYSIRNLYTPVRPGWRRRNRFYLAVVPAKSHDPGLSDIRIHWLGPHQINPSFQYPSDDEIAGFARQGINLVLGCAHWRSGEYSRPREPAQTRRVIDTCHRFGMKVIPYLTFTDLNHQVPAFHRHGQEWQIEPVAEFKHLTNLMCYGAAGWREYWKGEVDACLERFDFDGLYIDFWVGKMACTNHRHGCGHRHGRFTLPGLRDMALHAFREVKARGDGQFILSNTNMCAAAMVNNLVDVRLPGEWGNIEETQPEVVRGYLNSRRLGCNSLLLAGSVPHLSLRSISLFLQCQSSMTGWRGRKPAEQRLYMSYADILRSFGVARSTSLGAWEDDGSMRPSPESMVTYWHRNERGALVVGVDTEGHKGQRQIAVTKPGKLGLRGRGKYLLYRPDADCLLTDGPVVWGKRRALMSDLRAWEPLIVFITPARGRPQVLWATLSDGIEERWSEAGGQLAVRVLGVEGGESRVTVHVPGRATIRACQGGRVLRTRREGRLLTFGVACNEEAVLALCE